MKSARIEFAWEREIKENIPEIIEKVLKTDSERKDLEYHEKEAEYDGKHPTEELNQGNLGDLQKYYDQITYQLPKGKGTDDDDDDEEIEI